MVAGDNQNCTVDQLRKSLGENNVTALLFVSSRLTSGDTPDLTTSMAIAREFNIPVIVDAAAMDMRMAELVANGADLLTFSAQKYLAAPTAGIVVGKRQLIDAVNAQGNGIGRPMKPSKEAILGTLAAFEARSQIDQVHWSNNKKMEAQAFADSLQKIDHIEASLEKGLAYGDFLARRTSPCTRLQFHIYQRNCRRAAARRSGHLLRGLSHRRWSAGI